MTSHSLEFWPQYAQFVLYDAKTPFDPDQIPLFNADGEVGAAISVRKLEVSVALFLDATVRLELRLHPQEPASLEGDWMVNLQAVLEVPSGLFGVRDVVSDQPELALEVPAGKLNLRVHGRNDPEQFFAVQVWPVYLVLPPPCKSSPPCVKRCAKMIGMNVTSITKIATTFVTGRSRGRNSSDKNQIGSVA